MPTTSFTEAERVLDGLMTDYASEVKSGRDAAYQRGKAIRLCLKSGPYTLRSTQGFREWFEGRYPGRTAQSGRLWLRLYDKWDDCARAWKALPNPKPLWDSLTINQTLDLIRKKDNPDKFPDWRLMRGIEEMSREMGREVPTMRGVSREDLVSAYHQTADALKTFKANQPKPADRIKRLEAEVKELREKPADHPDYDDAAVLARARLEDVVRAIIGKGVKVERLDPHQRVRFGNKSVQIDDLVLFIPMGWGENTDGATTFTEEGGEG